MAAKCMRRLACPLRDLTLTFSAAGCAVARAQVSRHLVTRRVFSNRADAPPQSTRLRYWIDLWQQRQDVFTLEDANPNLVEFAHQLLPSLPSPEQLEAAAAAKQKRRGAFATLFGSSSPEEEPSGGRPRTIFVPLCGRSADLAWLAETYGHHVHIVGLDAVAEPLRLFATEFGGAMEPIAEIPGVSDPTTNPSGSSGPLVASYRTERFSNLTLIHGDVFAVNSETLGGAFDATWDRGGLTSIPTDLRQRYASHLAGMMAPGGRLMLEFLSCNLPLEGAASVGEVTACLTAAGLTHVRVLRSDDVRGSYPSFAPPGLTSLDEVVIMADKPKHKL